MPFASRQERILSHEQIHPVYPSRLSFGNGAAGCGGIDRPEIKNRIGVHSEAVTATNCGRLGNEAGIATTLNNIGVIHKSQGRYDEAMRRFEEALATFRRLGDEAGQV